MLEKQEYRRPAGSFRDFSSQGTGAISENPMQHAAMMAVLLFYQQASGKGRVRVRSLLG